MCFIYQQKYFPNKLKIKYHISLFFSRYNMDIIFETIINVVIIFLTNGAAIRIH